MRSQPELGPEPFKDTRRIRLGVGALAVFVAYAAYWAFVTRQIIDNTPTARSFRALKSSNIAERVAAADTLQYVAPGLRPRAIDALTRALGDPNSTVRFHAVLSLAGLISMQRSEHEAPIIPPDTIASLRRLLHDPDADVRSVARLAYGDIAPGP